MKNKYKVLSISKTGVTADFSDNVGRYHLIMRKPYPSEEDIENLVDGGYIIDKRPALERNLRVVIGCPILNVDRDPNYIENEQWPERKKQSIFYPKRFNKLNMKEVGLGVFVEYWREAGAKIGRKLNNKLIWTQIIIDDGEQLDFKETYYGQA